MLETIKYNKVDPVIKWAQFFITVATIKKIAILSLNKLRIPRGLVWMICCITYQQSIVK